MTTKTFPMIVIEIPRQLPPTAWVAHSDRDLIEACVTYCERAGEPYPEDAAAALAVLRHDLYALVTVTQEEWEAAHLCASPEASIGLPTHQRIAAYSAAADAARREGWFVLDRAGRECIRHSPDGSPIVWGPDGETRCATQRDMDTLPVGPDLDAEEWDAIDD